MLSNVKKKLSVINLNIAYGDDAVAAGDKQVDSSKMLMLVATLEIGRAHV